MSMNREINYFIYFVTGHISGRSYGAFFIFLHLVLFVDSNVNTFFDQIFFYFLDGDFSIMKNRGSQGCINLSLSKDIEKMFQFTSTTRGYNWNIYCLCYGSVQLDV